MTTLLQPATFSFTSPEDVQSRLGSVFKTPWNSHRTGKPRVMKVTGVAVSQSRSAFWVELTDVMDGKKYEVPPDHDLSPVSEEEAEALVNSCRQSELTKKIKGQKPKRKTLASEEAVVLGTVDAKVPQEPQDPNAPVEPSRERYQRKVLSPARVTREKLREGTDKSTIHALLIHMFPEKDKANLMQLIHVCSSQHKKALLAKVPQ